MTKCKLDIYEGRSELRLEGRIINKEFNTPIVILLGMNNFTQIA